MKKDVFNREKTFKSWLKESLEFGVDGINKTNSDLILDYVQDMEQGRNIARGSKKGARSYSRLEAIRSRMIFLSKTLERRDVKDLRKTKENTIVKLFNDMRKGELKKKNGDPFKSVADYTKTFKSFWHWLQKIEKKKGNRIEDITTDLDSTYNENTFVYFTLDQLKEMLPYFNENEQVMLLFAFDTIIRSPTELSSLKVSDVSDFQEVNIPDAISKTYGRRIKILLCSDELKAYVKRNKLKPSDYLFEFSPAYINRKLKKVAIQLFGDKMTKGGKSFKEFSLYDIRHCGAIHWRLGAYNQKIDALMYRGGWSNLTMLNYYTKKMGLKDTIEKNDLLIEVDKHELEKKLDMLLNILGYSDFEELQTSSKDLPKNLPSLMNMTKGKIKPITPTAK